MLATSTHLNFLTMPCSVSLLGLGQDGSLCPHFSTTLYWFQHFLVVHFGGHFLAEASLIAPEWALPMAPFTQANEVCSGVCIARLPVFPSESRSLIQVRTSLPGPKNPAWCLVQGRYSTLLCGKKEGKEGRKERGREGLREECFWNEREWGSGSWVEKSNIQNSNLLLRARWAPRAFHTQDPVPFPHRT